MRKLDKLLTDFRFSTLAEVYPVECAETVTA